MAEEPLNNETVEEGAPKWVVTFGDLMSLLLCFFVLLLSFSETDKATYKEVAGSMSEAFGIQRKVIVFDSPKGEKIIAKNFDQEAISIEISKKFKKEIENLFLEKNKLIQVEINKRKVSVRLMGETTFDSGKADIKEQMIPLLKKIGSILKETKGDIIIAGHTDNVPVKGGQYKSNLRLSAARAASVAEFLIGKASVDPWRISTMGFGKHRPLHPNNTLEGRQKNRRVEITIDVPEKIKKSI